MQYGGAAEGDCTMLDVLVPVARVLRAGKSCSALPVGCTGQVTHDASLGPVIAGERSAASAVAQAVMKAASDGLQRTAQLQARAGRASYVAVASRKGYPDAGSL